MKNKVLKQIGFFLLFMVIVTSIIFFGCAFTKSERIKRKVWNNIEKGAFLKTKGYWWDGNIKLADTTLDPNNKYYDILFKEEFVKLNGENKLYIVTFIASKSYYDGYDKVIFADEEGKIIGYDITNSPPIINRDPK